MLRHFSFLFILIINSAVLFSQEKTKSVSIHTAFGKSVKHTPLFVSDPSENLAWLLGISYQIQTLDDKAWRQKAKYPVVGLNFIYTNFGNKQEYGSAVAFYPSIQFNFPPAKKLNGFFSTGFGLAYLNKTFSEETNSGNTGVGSHLNGMAVIKFGFEYKPGKIGFFADGGLTHFSNLGVTQPNLGLNFFNGAFGIKYYLEDTDYPEKTSTPKPENRWAFSVKSKTGFFDMEEEDYDDANDYFFVQSFSTYVIFRTSIINQLYSGFNYTMNFGQKEYYGKEAFHNLSWIIGGRNSFG